MPGCLLLQLLPLQAAELDSPKSNAASSGQDPATAMRLFHAAPGFKIDLFAAEPMVQNIVSFTFDERGRCYVVESNRRRTSVLDIRNFPEWLESDFAIRTVEQRADFFRRTLTPTNQAQLDKLSRVKRGFLPDLNHDGILDWRDLQVESERIRLLIDTNSDGHADLATTFAEGFNGITSGVAAGVLARHGNVWFTCIPDLWRFTVDDLRSTSGPPPDGVLPLNPQVANQKSKIENLLHGFGTHIAIGGHDLHGLKMGPDGRIYFSIADRGTSTNLWDKIGDHWPGLTMEALADSGAVFRCQPDGTQLEVVAIGLRNPQELAFDEFGNLFTGDNNGDGGDKSRWEYIVEGADYGWRMGWQWLPKMGAWNSEMLWGMAPSNTSSYYLPPVTHIAAGPAGMAYYPGTGLPPRYDQHFFLCDFRGGPNSLVYSFALRPKGASFEAFDESEFIRGFLCTDVDFGLDGAVYVSDWVKGWEKTGQGRIWRVFDPDLANNPAMLEVKKLLSEGMGKRSNDELVRLLGHRDMRVRWEAQFQLTRANNYETLREVAFKQKQTLPRLHALWALEQIVRTMTVTNNASWIAESVGLMPLLDDPDEQIRAAICRYMQSALLKDSKSKLESLLSDKSPRVAAFAAHALRALKQKETYARESSTFRERATAAANKLLGTSIGAPFVSVDYPRDQMERLFQDAHEREPFLFHAGVMLLAEHLGHLLQSNLAPAAYEEVFREYYGRHKSRAVRLACVLALRRLQRAEVASFLGDTDPKIVLEAARAINDVPIPAVTVELAQLLPRSSRGNEAPSDNFANPFVLRRAMNAHFRLGRKENASALVSFAAHNHAPEALRLEALELLSLWANPPGRDRIVGLWRPLPSRDAEVAARELNLVLPGIETNAPAVVKVAARKAAAQLASKAEETVLPDSESFVKISRTLESGTIAEKQAALGALASMNANDASQLLNQWLDKLLAGQVVKELRLDVLEAVRKNQTALTSPAVKEKLAKYETTRDQRDALAKWRECLYGGNAEEGKKTFLERQDAACLRCHKINGEGGEVGPDLAGIGQRQTREFILESILLPNVKISPGFESVLVSMKNGASWAGIVKSENDTQLVVNSPEDGLLTLKKADIQKRDRGLSAMPEGMAEMLSKQDLRNLVEFLATTSQQVTRP